MAMYRQRVSFMLTLAEDNWALFLDNESSLTPLGGVVLKHNRELYFMYLCHYVVPRVNAQDGTAGGGPGKLEPNRRKTARTKEVSEL